MCWQGHTIYSYPNKWNIVVVCIVNICFVCCLAGPSSGQLLNRETCTYASGHIAIIRYIKLKHNTTHVYSVWSFFCCCCFFIHWLMLKWWSVAEKQASALWMSRLCVNKLETEAKSHFATMPKSHKVFLVEERKRKGDSQQKQARKKKWKLCA